jgi:hypothetical protein
MDYACACVTRKEKEGRVYQEGLCRRAAEEEQYRKYEWVYLLVPTPYEEELDDNSCRQCVLQHRQAEAVARDSHRR